MMNESALPLAAVQIKREAPACGMLAGEVEAKRGRNPSAGCWKRKTFSWRGMFQGPSATPDAICGTQRAKGGEFRSNKKIKLSR